MLAILRSGCVVLTADELATLLAALRFAPSGFRDMALVRSGAGPVDCPDSWIALDPAYASEVGATAIRRFGPRDDRREDRWAA